MKKRTIGVLIAAASLFVTAACGGGGKPSSAGEHDGHDHSKVVSGDIQEKTASLQQLPSFLDKQREEIRIAYRVAAQAADVLRSMPCYCGCGESVGHKSNEDCFIQEINSDGSVVWDDHGTRCGVCMQIAVTSYQLKEQGKSVKEIRQIIDETYQKGYAKPTPTPMPS
ncbi:PCYCGC motif-containing (lipo)protein [Paenibacillus sp. GYB004]|uniref:PCYCGC motif-containing (lipo)protein n=1 Tax=Paenibacillus sp. GYB004 TaxID=2994393 RepID=UPI002F964162